MEGPNKHLFHIKMVNNDIQKIMPAPKDAIGERKRPLEDSSTDWCQNVSHLKSYHLDNCTLV